MYKLLKYIPLCVIVMASAILLKGLYDRHFIQKYYPNDAKMQNLLKAVLSEGTVAIEEAIKQGATVDKQGIGTFPLRYAFDKRKLKSFQYLLKKGANANITYDNRSLILDAIDRDNINYLKALVDNGCDVNLLHNLGRRPLYYALIKNRYLAAEYLIKNGSDICLADKYHRTVFTELLAGRDFNQCLYLLDNNLNPFLSDSHIQMRIKYSIEGSYKVRTPSSQYKNFSKLVQKLEQLGFKFELKEL